MPKDAYVAKSLTAGGKTFASRNDSLRPGGQAAAGGRAAAGAWAVVWAKVHATGDTQALPIRDDNGREMIRPAANSAD
jgi:hypothetical protein